MMTRRMALFVLVGATSIASAAPLTILNHSFEDPFTDTDAAIGQAIGIHFSNHTPNGSLNSRILIDNVILDAPDASVVVWNPAGRRRGDW